MAITIVYAFALYGFIVWVQAIREHICFRRYRREAAQIADTTTYPGTDASDDDNLSDADAYDDDDGLSVYDV